MRWINTASWLSFALTINVVSLPAANWAWVVSWEDEKEIMAILHCFENLPSMHLGPEQQTVSSRVHPQLKVSAMAPWKDIANKSRQLSSRIHHSMPYLWPDPQCSSTHQRHQLPCLLATAKARIQEQMLIQNTSMPDGVSGWISNLQGWKKISQVM